MSVWRKRREKVQELAKCSDCGWIGDAEDVETGICDMVFADPVDICPECGNPDCIAPYNEETK